MMVRRMRSVLILSELVSTFVNMFGAKIGAKNKERGGETQVKYFYEMEGSS
jgi:hypothetical protein